jgi:hypothetical protein
MNLVDLCKGVGNLTPERGATFCQAAAVSLDRQGHESGVRLLVAGAFNEEIEVSYPLVTERMRRSWKDAIEAADDSATGVAILLIQELEGMTVVERSVTSTGFDYWMGPDDKDDDELIFQDKVRLEISGINKGRNSHVMSRVKEKLKQTEQSDSWNLKAYVIVVEFSRPYTWVEKK